MRKFTVPVGIPTPGVTALRVRVKVTSVPGSAGLAEETIAPLDSDCVMVNEPPT